MKEDEGVVSVLEDSRRCIINDGVENVHITEGIVDKAPENVGDDYEKVR